MKILLIQPPIRDFYQTAIRTQPIGLAYVAASLQSCGHEVEILDCQTKNKTIIPIPDELAYLHDFYPFADRSPFKLYTGYYHFGMGWEKIKVKIRDSKADIFGISSSFTPYHGEALEIARIIKEWNRGKIVVMGGCHVSSDPKEVLKNPWVDYVILGEGEVRFPFLLEQIEKKGVRRVEDMDGVGYRMNGEIWINPLETFIEKLDFFPYPARELLDLDRYRMNKKRATMIITSRGCPHQCAYCSTHLFMGTSFRKRSSENIIQEMMECQKRFGIEIFDIEDDNFTFDQKRAKQLLSLMIETFGEGNLGLSAMNGVSFASLDGEVLQLMKKAGFKTINLSFVSIDSSTKEKMQRPKTVNDFDFILKEAEKNGLQVIAYAILGMPGQTIEEMVATIIYLMGKKILIGPSVYYPTPGTPLFERCKRDGVLPLHPSQWRSSAVPIETKGFNRLDIITLFRLTRVINFVKGKMDEKEFNEGMTWRELYQMLRERRTITIEAKAFAQEDLHCAPGDKDQVPTWIDLLLLLFKERSFFSLRKHPSGRIFLEKEETSQKVLDCFLEKAWVRPIMKSRYD